MLHDARSSWQGLEDTEKQRLEDTDYLAALSLVNSLDSFQSRTIQVMHMGIIVGSSLDAILTNSLKFLAFEHSHFMCCE